MAYEHKDGQGSMFRNEKQNDRQPDYKGTIMINGTVYEIAGWERTSQKGTSYISLQAGLPRERDVQQDNAPRQQYQRPAPQYSRPPMPEPAPMPTTEDMPAFDPGEDLPF